MLVNVDSGSGTLQAHSRLVWHQSARCSPGSCVFSAWISPDGKPLLAEAFGKANAPGTRLAAGQWCAVRVGGLVE